MLITTSLIPVFYYNLCYNLSMRDQPRNDSHPRISRLPMIHLITILNDA